VVTRQRSPRRPAQRPDQILDAAERLLAGGAADLNMDGVAEAAGLSKGTLYHYYAAKTDVLDALRRRYLERSVRAALAATSAQAPTLTRVGGFVRALLDHAAANAALVWPLFHGTGTSGGHLAIVGDALRDLIQDGVARGEFGIDNADAVAGFYAHGFFGRIQEAFHDPPGTAAGSPQRLADELVVMLERLVTPTTCPH
jgi:AcrR family transcriptional regulator